MDVVLGHAKITASKAGAVGLGIAEGERQPRGAAAEIDRRSRGAVTALLRSRDFGGRALEMAVLYPRGPGAGRLILVGLGKRAGLDAQRLRLAAAQQIGRAHV